MKKKALIITMACILMCAATVGVYFGVAGSIKEPTIIYASPDYIMDIDNPSVVSGFVDYVFVGRVDKKNETTYRNVTTYETDEKGETTPGLPYTEYEISVLENIKGNLKTNEAIPFLKFGGLSANGKTIVLEENDFLPKKGAIYVFYVSADEDGKLRILGKGGNITLPNMALTDNGGNKSPVVRQSELAKIEASPIYQELVEACENEIPFERERFTVPAELLETTTP